MHTTISGTFTRTTSSPEKKCESGWFALSHYLVPVKRDRRTARNVWYRIASVDSQNDVQCIYRVLRFDPTLIAGSQEQDKPAEIDVDYQGWIELSGFAEKKPKTLQLLITRATAIGIVRGMLHHPDPSIRVASWLAAISVILSAVGVGLGLSAFWV